MESPSNSRLEAKSGSDKSSPTAIRRVALHAYKANKNIHANTRTASPARIRTETWKGNSNLSVKSTFRAEEASKARMARARALGTTTLYNAPLSNVRNSA